MQDKHLRRQTKLVDVLCELANTSKEARELAGRAGVRIEKVETDGAAIDVWSSILREARKHQNLDALVDRAAFEYPQRESQLKEALQVFKDSVPEVNDGLHIQSIGSPLPELAGSEKLSLRAIRDNGEKIYFWGLIAFNVLFFACLGIAFVVWPRETIIFAVLGLSPLLSDWILWKFSFPTFYGQSIRIGPSQYPHLYRLFCAASERLGLREPLVLVFNGDGLLGLLLAKRFTRRGVITLTSNLLDALQQRASSRELMMIIGAQLGHLAAGHYRFWFFTDYIGFLAFGLQAAWKRRCQYTADFVGLILSGDTFSAEQGLLVLTVGPTLATGTDTKDLARQREELYDDVWAWLRLVFSHKPYWIDRLVRLRGYAEKLREVHSASPSLMGAIPLPHGDIRSRSIYIIHGRDRMTLLELNNFLYSRFPNLSPVVLSDEPLTAATIQEKLELIAGEVSAAIALLTSDDAIITESQEANPRSSRNVVIEIRWFWARLGRERCLLLRQRAVEVPSALSAVEEDIFDSSPVECAESIRSFLLRLDLGVSAGGASSTTASYDHYRAEEI